MSPEELAAWGDRSRAASGVPPTIEDPVVLVQLARLMRGADEHDDGGSRSTVRRRLRKQPTTSQEATRQRMGADER
jgi:hypothetical protein